MDTFFDKSLMRHDSDIVNGAIKRRDEAISEIIDAHQSNYVGTYFYSFLKIWFGDAFTGGTETLSALKIALDMLKERISIYLQ